ncbi:MAG: hypothetical protein HYU64_04640 [Armatimonadetes bacterium]|nr:hypothetical protein [Armatimonadota bacterium]
MTDNADELTAIMFEIFRQEVERDIKTSGPQAFKANGLKMYHCDRKRYPCAGGQLPFDSKRVISKGEYYGPYYADYEPV